jgi:predicted RNA-binding Zn-ribbon protein involved in translation (DUF1610 family)
MWQTQYYIDNQFVGHSEIGEVRVREHLVEPESIAYFCPRCGDVWARIVVCDTSRLWGISNNLCPRHGLGTMWIGYEKEHMAAFPRELLEREFLLAIADPKWAEYHHRERGPDGKMIPIRAQWDIDREAEEADDDIPIDDF